MYMMRMNGCRQPSADSTTEARRRTIREVLDRERIRSQGELLRSLVSRGFSVTQPSVSRDLSQMHVAKVNGRYVTSESLAARPPGIYDLGLAASWIVRTRPAGPHLTVVVTPPGRAQVVALALDGARWPEVVGTVAGDDTVFVATAGRRQQARLLARLGRLTEESKDA